ncbi:hypothetical protein RHGRI_035560 [Rhododendron griersonianum]|uniref:Uncharacterized protein n=1 Tax=Rhododendron griersonianum TaxID=479676 RepID=A0AAV6HNP0_9ERIC|nr:hypothetical protein RHGRI_035560 [Rhododendron griersonianum]
MTVPSAKIRSAGNFLSIVLAPTVVIQGATLATVMSSGPLLPAEAETKIPLTMAPNDPIAIGSKL